MPQYSMGQGKKFSLPKQTRRIYAHEQMPCPDYFEKRAVHHSSHTGSTRIYKLAAQMGKADK